MTCATRCVGATRSRPPARAVIDGTDGCGCGSGSCCPESDADSTNFGEELYDAKQRRDLPEAAVLASLGCGNPTAVAEATRGRDGAGLGSGGEIDVILGARGSGGRQRPGT